MRLISLMAAAAAVLSLAACGDNRTDDVVQTPAGGGTAVPVTNEKADLATAQTALALGMTRKELEDADLVSAQGVDLGDVESLVMDANGKVSHLVVEVDLPGDDIQVLLPLDKVEAHTSADGREKDLKTNLTVGELQSLPRYVPAA